MKKISFAVVLLSLLVLGSMSVEAADEVVTSTSELREVVKTAVYNHEDYISVDLNYLSLSESEAQRVIHSGTDLNYQRVCSSIEPTWCDMFSVTYHKNSMGYVTSADIMLYYNVSVKSDKMTDSFCQAWVESYISSSDSSVKSVRKIHNWIIRQIRYTTETDNFGAYTYRSAADAVAYGKGVCVSYATLFQKLCDAAGINCVTYYDSIPEGRHAWNYVEISGYWFGVDCTYDDPDYGEEVNYDYFLSNKGHLGTYAPSSIGYVYDYSYFK